MITWPQWHTADVAMLSGSTCGSRVAVYNVLLCQGATFSAASACSEQEKPTGPEQKMLLVPSPLPLFACLYPTMYAHNKPCNAFHCLLVCDQRPPASPIVAGRMQAHPRHRPMKAL